MFSSTAATAADKSDTLIDSEEKTTRDESTNYRRATDRRKIVTTRILGKGRLFVGGDYVEPCREVDLPLAGCEGMSTMQGVNSMN